MHNTLYYPALPFKSHILHTTPYKGGSTRAAGSSSVFKLSSNENPLGPSPLAKSAILDNIDSLHEYRFENDEYLRSAIGLAIGIDPERLITGNSGMELLDLVCRGFVEEGSEVILCSPTFMAYKAFANLSGAHVIDIPLQKEDFSLDVKSVLRAVKANTRILFLSNPNNPTGTLIPKKRMDELMDALPPHVLVIYDEVYHHYVESSDYPRAIEYIKRGQNLIGLHSFSKAFGLAGVRLGYAFGTLHIIEYLQHLRRPFMINTLATVAGIAALQDTDHILKTQALISTEKRWIYDQLDALGMHYWKSEANFILLRVPLEPDTLVNQLLQQGVMVRSAEVMHASRCIRVSVATRIANKAFIEALTVSLQDHKK